VKAARPAWQYARCITDAGLTNWDFSLIKDTKLGVLGEQVICSSAPSLQLMNHANFGIPNAPRLLEP